MPTPPDAAAATRPATVTIAAANIYLAREIYDTYFGGAAAVALLARDGKLLVMPLVADSAGGTLLKIRNRHGDRVIHAQEFFRDKGFAEDADAQIVDARWSADAAALVVEGLREAPMARRAIGNADAN